MRVCVVAAGMLLASCTRREPPQWDAGGASLSVVALPGSAAPALAMPADGGVAFNASGDGSGNVRSDGSASAITDAGPSDGGAASAKPREDDAGALPQTHDEPQPAGAQFDAGVAALWDAIVSDDADRALPFFFPVTAYEQVKAISNPSRDWRLRLVAAYKRDIHDLHLKLGPHVARAKLVRADVPMAKARWVEPGEEYNRIGYWRVFGTKLRGDIDGRPVTVDVTSLISWRGEWYCVHLTGVR